MEYPEKEKKCNLKNWRNENIVYIYLHAWFAKYDSVF
jgi:hypothetical protein